MIVETQIVFMYVINIYMKYLTYSMHASVNVHYDSELPRCGLLPPSVPPVLHPCALARGPKAKPCEFRKWKGLLTH
jgi:hypothetical protein